MRKPRRISAISTKIAVFFIYFILSCILTYPLIFNLHNTLWGAYGDSFANVYNLWFDKNYDTEINELISAPYSIRKPSEPHPLYVFFLKLPLMFLDEISSYNLIVLFSFPLSALAMFMLVDWIINEPVISAISGFIFGFSPFSVAHSIAGHLSFSMNFWLPLLVFSILYFMQAQDKDSRYPPFLLGVSYALVFLTNTYYGYIMLFFSISLIILIIRDKKRGFRVNDYIYTFFGLTMAGITALIIIIPFELETIRLIFNDPGFTYNTYSIFKRPFIELVAYSAKPWQYFTPSIDHPIFGSFIIEFTRTHLYGGNVIESTLYLGVVPILFVILGIRLKRDKRLMYSDIFSIFLISALIMIVFSGPPYIPILGDIKDPSLKIPMISSLLYKIAPMFRVYARFGVMVIFCMAVITAIVLHSIMSNIKSRRKRQFLTIIIILVTLLDFWNVPFNKAANISDPPLVYKWLAEQPGDMIIAEYPNVTNIDYNYYEYLFWQRIHKKRMINGAAPGTIAWEIWKDINDISKTNLPVKLNNLGVRYVIIHTEKFKAGPIPAHIKRYYPLKISADKYNGGIIPNMAKGFYFIRSFGNDVVYGLLAEKTVVT